MRSYYCYYCCYCYCCSCCYHHGQTPGDLTANWSAQGGIFVAAGKDHGEHGLQHSPTVQHIHHRQHGVRGDRQLWLRGSTYTLWKKVAILEDTVLQQPQEVRQIVLVISDCTRQPQQATAGQGGERSVHPEVSTGSLPLLSVVAVSAVEQQSTALMPSPPKSGIARFGAKVGSASTPTAVNAKIPSYN